VTDHAALAASFDRAAGVYERSRPGYPAALVDWLLRDAPEAVADVGAGTGKLTRLLAARVPTVHAVDPSPRMLDQLRAAVPTADVLVGSAEAIPLPDASVDLVAVAQAWHWVDPERALPEVRRVLRPGGALVLVWNQRDPDVPWVAALTEAMRPTHGDRFLETGALPEGEVERFVTTWELPFDRAGLHELVDSRSAVITADAPERAAIHAAVDAVLDAHPEAGGVMPYRTLGFRIRLAEQGAPGR
jgi:ubiquinone/menaquinone biosynthesis C-methylase UbiE